jgi:4-amino-4-deoxy-L-arabinose transferase-like glycosyltransferase
MWPLLLAKKYLIFFQIIASVLGWYLCSGQEDLPLGTFFLYFCIVAVFVLCLLWVVLTPKSPSSSFYAATQQVFGEKSNPKKLSFPQQHRIHVHRVDFRGGGKI